MLFLLFYYTDTLGFGIGWAATTYMIASIWDGVIGFIIGIEADRRGRAADRVGLGRVTPSGSQGRKGEEAQHRADGHHRPQEPPRERPSSMRGSGGVEGGVGAHGFVQGAPSGWRPRP